MATATETLERVLRAYSARDRLTEAQRHNLEAWLSRATIEVPGRVAPAITAGCIAWERAREEELARLRAEVERLRQVPAREEAAATDTTEETPAAEQEDKPRLRWLGR